MVFQDPYGSLNPRLPVASVLAEVLRFHKIVPSSDIDSEVRRLLEIVGLSPTLGDRRPRNLSGGQRQRIGLARALAVRPSFLVLDEPVAALDLSIQAQVVNLLKDLRQELGLTMLFIAHELSVVRYVTDRVAVMYLGRIVETVQRPRFLSGPVIPTLKACLNQSRASFPRNAAADLSSLGKSRVLRIFIRLPLSKSLPHSDGTLCHRTAGDPIVIDPYRCLPFRPTLMEHSTKEFPNV